MERSLPLEVPEFRRREVEAVDQAVAVRVGLEGIRGPPIQARKLVGIGEPVMVRVGVRRIRLESVLRQSVPLQMISEAVEVGIRGGGRSCDRSDLKDAIDLELQRPRSHLRQVGQGIIVGVRPSRIGAEHDALDAIGKAVPIRVRDRRIRRVLRAPREKFRAVGQTVTVRIEIERIRPNRSD